MKLSRILKPVFQHDITHKVLSWLVAQYIWFAFKTTRWTYIGVDDGTRSYLDAGKPLFALLWHNRIAMMPMIWRTKPYSWKATDPYILTIIVSSHRDGQIVRRGMEHFEIENISVESDKNQLTAAKMATRAIKAGKTIGMTPDGPRGPRMRMKDSPIGLARICKARISFITYSVKHRIVLDSWDRFIVPLPFSKGVIIWREGFAVPDKLRGEELAAMTQKVEDALTEMTNEADRMMGHAPIEPAPRATP
jgi:lysophospholipid acyltransferase (LPLAT)-like uncharacterized protein